MTTGNGVISAVSVSHEEATVGDLDTAAAPSQRAAVATLLEDTPVEEAYVLQTCNRIEAYVVAENHGVGHGALDTVVGDVDSTAVRRLDHEASLRHLLRVAAGLESVVLGEDQILGQVEEAYEDARGEGAIGPILELGVTKAITVGKRARTETEINEGAVSLAGAAVRLARERYGLDGTTAVVVGAGEMGTLAAKQLAANVDRLLVANRTVPHAEHVARTVDVEASAVGLDAVPAAVERADLVVSATGSQEPVVPADALAKSGETFVIDLAQPRDVAPAADDFDSTTVYDLDTLEAVTEKTRRSRREAAAAVESIVEDELGRLLAQYKRKRADAVISAMYESAERIKAEELETARGKLDLDSDEAAVVESMADAIVSELLSAPTNSLRDAAADDDWATIHTALQLFNPHLDEDVEPSGAPPAADEAIDPEAIPEAVRETLPEGALSDRTED